MSAETELSIASVTTAYNAAHVLGPHIDALLGQERPLQEIIVVDNASSDETRSLLADRYPQVTVIHMDTNLGTGGALATGLAYAAFEKRHDWIWMFDQDSCPPANTLEIMLLDAHRSEDKLSEVGILAALPVDQQIENSASPWLWRNGFLKPPAESFAQPLLFTDLVITSGAMLRREVLEKIGLPRSDFFIDFVDYEYCLRARSHGYKIAVVTRAKLYHEIGQARKVTFLGRQRHWSNHAPFREYYMSRNLVYSVWWLYPSLAAKGHVLQHLVRHAAGVILFGSARLACLKKMVQGFWDGRRASLGVRFLPD